jgi:hypothetical protein
MRPYACLAICIIVTSMGSWYPPEKYLTLDLPPLKLILLRWGVSGGTRVISSHLLSCYDSKLGPFTLFTLLFPRDFPFSMEKNTFLHHYLMRT